MLPLGPPVRRVSCSSSEAENHICRRPSAGGGCRLLRQEMLYNLAEEFRSLRVMALPGKFDLPSTGRDLSSLPCYCGRGTGVRIPLPPAKSQRRTDVRPLASRPARTSCSGGLRRRGRIKRPSKRKPRRGKPGFSAEMKNFARHPQSHAPRNMGLAIGQEATPQ